MEAIRERVTPTEVISQCGGREVMGAVQLEQEAGSETGQQILQAEPSRVFRNHCGCDVRGVARRCDRFNIPGDPKRQEIIVALRNDDGTIGSETTT